MQATHQVPIADSHRLGNQLCRWLARQEYGMVLRSNGYRYGSPLHEGMGRYELLAGVGATQVIRPQAEALESFRRHTAQRPGWWFGYLGYDLKNEIERLASHNPDGLKFPPLLFFQPRVVFTLAQGVLGIHYHPQLTGPPAIEGMLREIYAMPAEPQPPIGVALQRRFEPGEYLEAVRAIQGHIQRGDIYELTFCQEFYAWGGAINPFETFIRLNSLAASSFAVFGRFGELYLLCASPERYLQRRGQRLSSQPIKGTRPRGATPQADEALRQELRANRKERAENVMIVDLVRNDLARIARRGTVRVDELCGVYPFRQVHQMVSTVSCQLPPGIDATDCIRATFPMGSMTGAPKVRAMALIEQYERARRGLFSGAVGYLDPQGDFDFNVVIRSLLYNQGEQYLSYSVGSAITAGSDPEQEYQECLLKAKALREVLGV